MTNQKLTEGIQLKLLLKLLEYDYEIQYKKGKENLVADALSRRDNSEDASCNTITVFQPDWLTDVAASYIGDTDSSALL